MANLSIRFALFFFCFAFVEAEKDPYYIKKSLFCFSDQSSQICADDSKYDFYSVVKEIVNSNDKLGKEDKDIAKTYGDCTNALKDAICSMPSLLCFDENDNSGPRRVCSELRKKCPLLSGQSFDKYEDRCLEFLQINLTCVSTKEDKKFKGFCPRPSQKMPASYWSAYKLKSDELEDPMEYLTSVNKATGFELLSKDCLDKIKDAVCMPLYCTEDEKSIIVPNLLDKCNAVLECVSKASDKYEKLSSVLEPIKKALTGGCDKIVDAIKAESSARASNDAERTSHTQRLGPELLLVTITLFVIYFY